MQIEKEDLKNKVWSKKHDILSKNGFKGVIHTRPLEGSAIQLVRIDAITEKLTLKTIDLFISNFSNTSVSQDQYEELKVLEKDPEGRPQ